MKALTLHQPWASLVALGVKTIETRSWSTSYRGPLAIHAAKRHPVTVADYHPWQPPDSGGEWAVARSTTKPGDLFGSHETVWCPLGAIVAVVDLVDVVPITIEPQARDVRRRVAVDRDGVLRVWSSDEIVGYSGWVGDGGWYDQLPFGDFAPGRFAWFVGNVRPLTEPIPYKGRQGLWNLPDIVPK